MRKAIAIDFDGCLCENNWPEIGAPHMEVITAAIDEKNNGAALILWTCRVGEKLGEAVAWCAGFGLEFDAVNANLPERIAAYRNDCRKVNADEYWDDRAVVMGREAETPTQEEMKGIREKMLRDAVLRDAVETWGMEAQQRMMIEEMSELTKAVCKLARAKIGAEAELAVENIREEMADVQIMLDQMKVMFGEPVDQERKKIERLRRRLEAAHEKKGCRK